MAPKLKVRKDDEVVVITGRDKGKSGKVIRVIPDELRVVVHVGTHEFHPRQALHRAAMGQAPRGHDEARATGAEVGDELGAQRAAHEAGAAKQDDVSGSPGEQRFEEGLGVPVCASVCLGMPWGGAQGRSLSGAGAPAPSGPMEPPSRLRNVGAESGRSTAA